MTDKAHLEGTQFSLCAAVEQSEHGRPVCSKYYQKGGASGASVQGPMSILIWLPNNLCPTRSNCSSSTVLRACSSRHIPTIKPPSMLVSAGADDMRALHDIGNASERHELYSPVSKA